MAGNLSIPFLEGECLYSHTELIVCGVYMTMNDSDYRYDFGVKWLRTCPLISTVSTLEDKKSSIHD